MSKKQNLFTKFFAKNKSVESTDHETGLPEVSIENTDKGSKAEKRKFQDFGSQSFRGSFMIPVMLVMTLCTFVL
jgi:hypothetical protein